MGVLVGVIRLYRPSFLGRLGEERIGESGYFALMTRGPTSPSTWCIPIARAS